MNTAKVRRSIHRIVNSYKAKLAQYEDEVFTQTPPADGWSYSEVYSHIFDASLLSLIALNDCISGKGENQPTHFAVKMILFMGAFPPAAKYKVPQRLASRVKKIAKTEALDFILEFETAFEQSFAKIADANPKVKTKHPRLGYLNAKQWLRFIEIHLKHHLKQLQRIEKSFQQSI
ncbi:DinB family protein [Pedobacter sandarakinus]|uniref:DinB family protein n=1 Tax=Pedobacter sandarakinus TaxID=353156 RepID=UPI0022484D58|nr:DinB family protein [Pedobacter sandarakinus]MCX2573969.1 DinB family protein [Pedobacter sandarakinus]